MQVRYLPLRLICTTGREVDMLPLVQRVPTFVFIEQSGVGPSSFSIFARSSCFSRGMSGGT